MRVTCRRGHYGPVAPMMSCAGSAWRRAAASTAPCWPANQFYQTNYTKPLLFLSGGGYFEERAEGQHCSATSGE